MENITQMRLRHDMELEVLRSTCDHPDISNCMPFAWAPGHISHCVKVCNFCGKEVFTTYKGNAGGDENRQAELTNPAPADRLFECPTRTDCHFWK